MILRLDLATHKTLAELRQFLEALAPSRAEAYALVERTMRRFSYWTAHKAERGLLRSYLERTTGLSRAQVPRMIAAHSANGELADMVKGTKRAFRQRYTREDVLLPVEADAHAHALRQTLPRGHNHRVPAFHPSATLQAHSRIGINSPTDHRFRSGVGNLSPEQVAQHTNSIRGPGTGHEREFGQFVYSRTVLRQSVQRPCREGAMILTLVVDHSALG